MTTLREPTPQEIEEALKEIQVWDGGEGREFKRANNMKTDSELLNSILNARSVEAPTEDFFERTRNLSPEEFSKEFNKLVDANMGFSGGIWASLKRAIRGWWK